MSFSFLPYLFPPTSSSPQYNDYPSQYAGAGLLSLGAAIFALLVVQHVTAEKQAKLLAMLRMNGMFDSSYWLSTLLVWSAIALFASLLATCIGVACGLQVYANVSFAAHWLSLWLYILAMIASGLFLASMFTKAAWINLLSFLFISLYIGYSVGMTVSSGPFPPILLEVSHVAPIGVFFNALLPVYHYTKIWYVFSQNSQWQTVSNQTVIDNWEASGGPGSGTNNGWPTSSAGILQLQHMSFSDMSRPAMKAGRHQLQLPGPRVLRLHGRLQQPIQPLADAGVQLRSAAQRQPRLPRPPHHTVHLTRVVGISDRGRAGWRQEALVSMHAVVLVSRICTQTAGR